MLSFFKLHFSQERELKMKRSADKVVHIEPGDLHSIKPATDCNGLGILKKHNHEIDFNNPEPRKKLTPDEVFEELKKKNFTSSGIRTGKEELHIYLQKLHNELKHLLSLITRFSLREHLSLLEIQVICPQLAIAKVWAAYKINGEARTFDRMYNSHQLDIEFRQTQLGNQFTFHIDATHMEGALLSITFVPRDKKKSSYCVKIPS